MGLDRCWLVSEFTNFFGCWFELNQDSYHIYTVHGAGDGVYYDHIEYTIIVHDIV